MGDTLRGLCRREVRGFKFCLLLQSLVRVATSTTTHQKGATVLRQYVVLSLLAVATVACSQSESFRMEGPSMEPNISAGRVVPVQKAASSDLRRGDVIVFHFPLGSERQFMKRIVALPGEQIEIKNGIIFVDGHEIFEPYELHRDSGSMKPAVLSAGEYFVLGDNRPRSNDSRNWGPLPLESIAGRVVVPDSIRSADD